MARNSQMSDRIIAGEGLVNTYNEYLYYENNKMHYNSYKKLPQNRFELKNWYITYNFGTDAFETYCEGEFEGSVRYRDVSN